MVGFVKENLENKNYIVKKDFTNAICFGETGIGKTSSFILPNIEDRIKSNYGMIIFDYKGDMHLQIKYLAKKYNKLDKVLELGKQWGESINLVDFLNTKIIKDAYLELNKKGMDGYWSIAASEVLGGVFKILKIKKELDSIFNLPNEPYQFKLSTIHYVINRAENMSKFINHICENVIEYKSILGKKIKKEKINNLDSKVYILNNHIFRIINEMDMCLENLNNFKNYNEKAAEEMYGKYGVLYHLNSGIGESFLKSYINEDNENEKLDILKALNNESIIIINCRSFDNITNVFLIKTIYELLFDRISMGQDKLHPVSIFVDEAHKIISEYTLPETSICRSINFEYIFSVQSEEMLINKIGTIPTKTLLTNVREQIYFVNNFEYKINNKKTKSDPIFISEEDLKKVELEYQIIKKIKEKYMENSEENILVYDAKLEEENKCYVKNIKKNDMYVKYVYKNTKKYENFYKDIEKYIVDYEIEKQKKELKEIYTVKEILRNYKTDLVFEIKSELLRKLNEGMSSEEIKEHKNFLEKIQKELINVMSLGDSCISDINDIINVLEKKDTLKQLINY